MTELQGSVVFVGASGSKMLGSGVKRRSAALLGKIASG